MVFIKQVIVQGFKSYKHQTAIEEFDPGHNVIVGKNGSGKSNFFSAIRFVLSDMFSTLPAKERKNLLHEGVGASAVSGFVEIIFDNSDGRFPTVEGQEVVLRRSIGLKKDEFFLNLKHVSKADVINLLESAGFSRSNPYYIVQQGRVNLLATMKDSERLDLLKEVAGTSVYDERKHESEKIMHETALRRQKIDEIVQYIDERLAELDAEQKELKEYQRLDKERRSLEFAIYDKEHDDIERLIHENDTSRKTKSKSASELHDELRAVQDDIAAIEKNLRGLKGEQESLEREKSMLDSSREDEVKEHANAEIRVRELEDRVEQDRSAKDELDALIARLEGSVAKEEGELAAANQALREAQDKEQALKTKLQRAQQELSALQSIEGRRNQFASKEERDLWLTTTIHELQRSMQQSEQQANSLQQEVDDLRAELDSFHTMHDELSEKIKQNKALIDTCAKDLHDCVAHRNQLHNQRKQLWRKDDELQKELQAASDELKRSEADLQSTANRALNEGLRAVRRLEKEHSLQGVYGPLINLFECDQAAETAVEVTAGNSLFDVVVDSSLTATRLIELLNAERCGRVTFLPLRELRPPSQANPGVEGVAPLLDRVRVLDEATRPAFQQVFGRTLLCDNLQLASKTAAEHDMDCVTIHGDKVNRKGAVTGGFHDHRVSRLAAQNRIRDSRRRIDTARDHQAQVQADKTKCDQEISQVLNQIQRLESNKTKYADIVQIASTDLEAIPANQQRIANLLDEKRSAIERLRDTQLAQAQIHSLQRELETDMDVAMSSQDQQNRLELTRAVDALEKELAQHSAHCIRLSSQKDNHQIRISNILLRRLSEARSERTSLEANNRAAELDQARADLDTLKDAVGDSLRRLRDLTQQLQDKSTEFQKRAKEVEDKRALEADKLARMQGTSQDMERLVNKHNMLLDQKAECMRKKRDLGAISAQSQEELGKLSVKELQKRKQKCSEGLKRYSHVNKKALDQYLSFTEQRATLGTRRQELDSGAQSIQELISVLDQRKDAAIERTFKDVAAHFSAVFSALVPQGSAKLVMVRRKRKRDDDDDDDMDEREEEGEISKIGQYQGVAIRATFTHGANPNMSLNQVGLARARSLSLSSISPFPITHLPLHDHSSQLSGGQKSLVALTLIFAIQRCDPAPFYLFDEIDANLDAAHRTAVATMIQEQSDKAQFISTTFRPEFLHAATKFYGVTYSNKISRVGAISRQAALGIIAEEEAEREAAL